MRSDPLPTIQKLIKERYVDAHAVFWAGSVSVNQGTSASDLDLVIVFEEVALAYREAFIYDGWPIDAFIHDLDTLRYFCGKLEASDGKPALIHMILHGQEILAQNSVSMEAKAIAAEALANGPDTWNQTQIDKERFLITDILDDIKSPKNKEEQIISTVHLFEPLLQFYFRATRKWTASGKSLIRLFKQENPKLAEEWTTAFEILIQTSDASGIESTVTKILAPHGGYLWDGFRSDVPADWKVLKTPTLIENNTTIIYLTGKPGVGKYTIAKELASNHGFIVCDNQLINNPIFELLQYDGYAKIPDFAWGSIARIRAEVFDFLAHHTQNSYVLTNCLADTEEDKALYEEVEKMAQARGSLFIPVQLEISKEEHLKRLIRPERRERWKSIDPSDAEDNGPLISISHPNLLKLNISNLSAEDAASRIVRDIINIKAQPQSILSPDLARKLIAQQFPEYSNLPITDVEKQGHDNRTYRLGRNMLIRMPTAEDYALKVPKEQELLPGLTKRLSIRIPAPIKMGKPSADYPYPFSIYKWLPGKSINLLTLTDQEKEQLAFDMAKFLKELQSISDIEGPEPGQHNWWRGDHISVYDKGAREQIAELDDVIDASELLALWDKACATKWDKKPVWIHGDFAIGNILMDGGKLSAVIDFGGAAVGDPACDLVIAWTYLSGKARDIFISKMDMDPDTWLRARAWALWKATFELCQIEDKNSQEADLQKRIIDEVMNG